MTTYSAIPDSDIDPESPGTTGLFTLLRDNPIAMFEKAAGAPVLANGYIVTAMYAAGSVDQTAVGASAIGRGELKSTTATSVSGSIGAGGKVNAALTRDCFYPNVYVETSGQLKVHQTGHSTDGTSGDSPRLGLANTDVTNSYAYAIDYRYVQA